MSALTPSSPATPRSFRSPSIMQGLKRRERALGTHWWNPPFLVPLVEVIQTAVDQPGRHRLHHETACRRRQEAGACEEGRARLHRQPAAARALARGDCAGRERHLRRRDGRQRHQGGVRAQACRARAAGECRHGRHRSDAGDPPERAGRYRQPARPLALSGKAGGRRQARLQVRRRLPHLEPGAAGGIAGQGRCASERRARDRARDAHAGGRGL